MILAIDIGNTNIVIGCIEGKECAFVERLFTVRTKTELEYAIDIKNVLDIYHIEREQLEGDTEAPAEGWENSGTVLLPANFIRTI